MQIKYPSPALQRRRTLRSAILAIIGVTVMVTFINQIGQSDDVCLAGEMSVGLIKKGSNQPSTKGESNG